MLPLRLCTLPDPSRVGLGSLEAAEGLRLRARVRESDRKANSDSVRIVLRGDKLIVYQSVCCFDVKYKFLSQVDSIVYRATKANESCSPGSGCGKH